MKTKNETLELVSKLLVIIEIEYTVLIHSNTLLKFKEQMTFFSSVVFDIYSLYKKLN